jgi:phosphotransferase system IIA component
MEREDDAGGYGTWLKSNEDIDEEKNIHYSQIGEEMEKKKRQLQAVIVHEGINDLQSNYQGATNLLDSAPSTYSSDIFSNLGYEDLRKAHTETVIPVTMEDYNNVKKFRNVNEYNQFRNSQSIVPFSDIQSQEYLRNKNKIEETEASKRAYRLAKQLEESQKKQEQSWASMRTIHF